METRKYAARNWASMDTDILCSIFTRLPYVDLLCVNSTCWGWNAAVDLFKSCSATSSFQEIPWLIFTPHEDAQGEKTGRFMNIEENKIYPFSDLAAKKMNDGCYRIRSSHDWLVCLDERAIPYLLNLFSSHRIDLPHFDLSLGVEKIYGIGKQCIIKTVDRNIKRDSFVKQAVLSSSPSLQNKYYYLVMIYGDTSSSGVPNSLAFWKDGHTSWTKLDGEHYNDIVFHENRLYGFYSSDYPKYNHLIVWDMNRDGFNVVKKIDIMNGELKSGLQSPYVFFAQFYLVESQGSLLVVRRYFRYEDEINNWERGFNIFKLDMEQKLWRMVESLCGYALFLGGNQCISADVRNCKTFQKDSIYFIVDLVNLSGVFSLKDNSVNWSDWLDGTKREKQRSTPTWVVPRLK